MANLLGLNRLNIEIPDAGIIRIVSGATVTIYNTNADGTSPVTVDGTVSVGAVKSTLYADRAKVATKANPIIADSQGLIEFYTDTMEVHFLITTPSGITYGVPWFPVSFPGDPDILDIRLFGAKGDGVTDDTQAILRAIAALGSRGGEINFPDNIYQITAKITVPRNVYLVGSGYLEDEGITTSATIIRKAATMTTTGIELGACCGLKNLTVSGVAGNTGDGVQIKGNSCVLRDVSIFKAGGVGLRIGHSDATNCNHWRLYNVTCRANVSHGLYIHSNDSDPNNVEANAGAAFGINCNLNGGDGIRMGNASMNSFTGHSSLNTGYGLYLGEAGHQRSQSNVFSMLYIENNTAGGVFINDALATDNLFLGTIPNTGTFTDVAGARTLRIGRDAIRIGAAILGEMISNGPAGGSFTGNEQYLQFYADAAGRIRLGWKDGTPATGLVPAQVIADVNTLYLASRDTGAGKVKIMAGTGLVGYILLDPQNSKIELSTNLMIPTGFVQMTEISDPSAPAANIGRLYVRDNGAGKSQLVIRFNTGAIQVIATEP